ncbi:MAG: PhzF family phenazine biosynthesis protein, partial [Desulfatiglandales bacterium]|nr:PhzF family phenazine biosynthesis protein [Desulfatiglandales bacterium]
MGVKIFQVDAFADKPFTGNPAAVCILSAPRDESWMQNVALEMNLSETAFLNQQENGFNLRWFTPVVEVDLCGHATLASAHILWEIDLLSPQEQAKFHTRSGLLTAEHKGDKIELNFPATPEEPVVPPPRLSEALGVVPKYVGKSKFDYLVEVDSEEAIRNLRPDFALLRTLPIRGIIVTSSASSSGYDFVSRFFAPSVGVNEDPVTGSAHCCLGSFWSRRFGKRELIAHQASKRGGIVHIRVTDDHVFLGGQAVTVLRGELV